MLGHIRNWRRDERGTTAIEFSFMAIPFITLVLAIIEVSLMFATAFVLEGATNSAARMIRTGQIQQAAADTAGQEVMFRDAVCDHAVILVDCGEVTIEAVNIGQFGSFENSQPQFDDDGNMVSQGFDAGGVSNVILVRTAYRYRLMTPFVSELLGENGTGTRYFMSTIVLQTEPYEFQEI